MTTLNLITTSHCTVLSLQGGSVAITTVYKHKLSKLQQKFTFSFYVSGKLIAK